MVGRFVGWGGGVILLRHRRQGGVRCNSSSRMLVGSLIGMNVGWEWRLKWETEINRVALTDVQSAKAVRAEGDLRGIAGGHCADGALRVVWGGVYVSDCSSRVKDMWRLRCDPGMEISAANFVH